MDPINYGKLLYSDETQRTYLVQITPLIIAKIDKEDSD